MDRSVAAVGAGEPGARMPQWRRRKAQISAASFAAAPMPHLTANSCRSGRGRVNDNGNLGKQDAVDGGVIPSQDFDDELSGLDTECFGPGGRAFKRDASPTRFQLRNERVVFGADFLGELPLSQVARRTELLQPQSGVAVWLGCLL